MGFKNCTTIVDDAPGGSEFAGNFTKGDPNGALFTVVPSGFTTAALDDRLSKTMKNGPFKLPVVLLVMVSC